MLQLASKTSVSQQWHLPQRTSGLTVRPVPNVIIQKVDIHQKATHKWARQITRRTYTIHPRSLWATSISHTRDLLPQILESWEDWWAVHLDRCLRKARTEEHSEENQVGFQSTDAVNWFMWVSCNSWPGTHLYSWVNRGINGEKENAQSSKRYQRGIRTRAHLIASPAFYHWATELPVKTGHSPAKKGRCWQQQRWGVSEKLQERPAWTRSETKKLGGEKTCNQQSKHQVFTCQADRTNSSPE